MVSRNSEIFALVMAPDEEEAAAPGASPSTAAVGVAGSGMGGTMRSVRSSGARSERGGESGAELGCITRRNAAQRGVHGPEGGSERVQ